MFLFALMSYKMSDEYYIYLVFIRPHAVSSIRIPSGSRNVCAIFTIPMCRVAHHSTVYDRASYDTDCLTSVQGV